MGPMVLPGSNVGHSFLAATQGAQVLYFWIKSTLPVSSSSVHCPGRFSSRVREVSSMMRIEFLLLSPFHIIGKGGGKGVAFNGRACWYLGWVREGVFSPLFSPPFSPPSRLRSWQAICLGVATPTAITASADIWVTGSMHRIDDGIVVMHRIDDGIVVSCPVFNILHILLLPLLLYCVAVCTDEPDRMRKVWDNDLQVGEVDQSADLSAVYKFEFWSIDGESITYTRFKASSNINISNIFYQPQKENRYKVCLTISYSTAILNVNNNKCKVVIFNSRSEEQPYKCNGGFLELVIQFKYLGLLVDKSANMLTNTFLNVTWPRLEVFIISFEILAFLNLNYLN